MNAGQDNTMIAIHESALAKIGDVLIALQDETIKRLSDATEAAEAQRDTAWSELREIREAIHADENEATSDEVRRVISERDELARKLAEIKSILAGGRTVGGDVEQAYRDAEEIAEDGANAHKAMIQ